MEIFPELCPWDAVRLVVRVAGRKKGGTLKYKTRTQRYLGTRIPGSRHIAHSFGKLGLDQESVGGPDHFLPSAIMLDPPGQRLKLADGPSVSYGTRRSRALEIVKSWKRFPKSWMLTLDDFSGAIKFHELRQNASAFRDKFHKYMEKSSPIIMALNRDKKTRFTTKRSQIVTFFFVRNVALNPPSVPALSPCFLAGWGDIDISISPVNQWFFHYLHGDTDVYDA